MSAEQSRSFVSSTISRAVSLPLNLYRNYLSPTFASTSPNPHPPTNATPSQTAVNTVTLPSPLTFLTSSYLLLSLSLAFLLHRIHHLVPPAHHRPFLQNQDQQRERVNSRLVQIGVRLPGIFYLLKTSAALFLASTTPNAQGCWWLKEGSWTRTVFKLLQTSTRLICGKGELGNLLESPSSYNHSSLLWQTFLSIACSITLETLVRSLSGDEPNLHSFNLLSFSFLLHVQSHSSSATTTGTGGQGEDDRQLYIYLLLTLLELVSLQISYLLPYFKFNFSSNRRQETISVTTTTTTTTTKRFRFPITLFFSLFSQYLAIRSYLSFYRDINSPLLSTTRGGEGGDGGDGGDGGGGGALIWFNKLPEIGFELVVTVSLGLKLFAALIRGEELSQENILGPPIYWDSTEDYAVVLIKYTTALLKATRLSNLSYELSPLNVLPSTISQSLESIGFDLSSTTTTSTTLEDDDEEGGLRIRLERNGDVLLMEELEESIHSNRNGNGELRRRLGKGRTEALEYGFGVEIRKIDIEPLKFGNNDNSSYEGLGEWDGEWGNGFDSNEVEYGLARGSSSSNPGDVGIGMVQGERRNYFFKFLTVLLRIGFYLVYVSIKFSIDSFRFGLRKFGLRSLEGRLRDTWTIRERDHSTTRRRGSDLEGDDEDEEEDEDWKPSEEEDDEDESSTSDEEDEGEEEEENSLALISDLSKRPPPLQLDESQGGEFERLSPSELAPYLLAHHLSPSSSTTLTRRRYQSLLQPPKQSSSSSDLSSLDHLNTAITSSLKSNRNLIRMTKEERESKRQEWRESRSNFCVVCTVEPRTVILWPCRCLALCESCREALALRTTASTPGDARDATGGGGGGVPGAGTGGNLCPTCRSAVAGFSRIFIP